MVEVVPDAEGRSPPVLTGIEIINPAPETRCRASHQLVFLAASSASSDLDFYHGLLDVAETLTEGQLGKSQTRVVIEAGKGAGFVIATITCSALLEFVRREDIHQLGEDKAANMHASLSGTTGRRPNGGQKCLRNLKSKNPCRHPILMTPWKLLTASEAVAGHYCSWIVLFRVAEGRWETGRCICRKGALTDRNGKGKCVIISRRDFFVYCRNSSAALAL